MKPFLLIPLALALTSAPTWCDDSGALAAPVSGALAAPASGALAAPVFDPTRPQRPTPDVRIEMQVVAVPERIGIALMPDLKSKEKIEAANTRIQQMLAKGTAKLIGWPIMTTHTGQRAVIEAIKEIRWATEYHPPTLNVSEVPADPPAKVTPSVDVSTLEAFPTAFETRNAGVTLEVEPVIAPDGKTIDLNIVPQHVRLTGFKKVTIEGAAHKGKTIVEQPEFNTNKVTTSRRLKNGERVLMGIYPTEDPPKHLEIFLLKVELVPVE
ncbi:hypothetical protein CfE428DRAFT_3406 [Chthoniobacter flavus Ellin428]|uniref:Type II/III secretion system secretin-like domain-containing protein n=1 Tax=Chthoniobacter flavus Ellin428 TaxID=497964 RepID=B4D3B8_9BACT|nr:hypothetical protein [Chthoniobacter flavus]EDY19229.1 hypothetical protein CfE428DRAFT_3406 [Chthoniobacter flavus Ellin428]TCO88072.1 type II/III secretion system protein [Chthoniobacter flavus]